jgi:hypothetical protein
LESSSRQRTALKKYGPSHRSLLERINLALSQPLIFYSMVRYRGGEIVFPSLKVIDKLLANFGEGQLHNVHYETQNKEYEGATFFARHFKFRSRRAKLTPKKKGYFVVFWEKNANNQNQAFTYKESPEKVVITIIDGHLKGQFLFPKALMYKKGVLRDEHNKGKMAIRVYPSWEADLNKSASKTQQWQSAYFLDLTKEIDKKKIEDLYFI